MNRIKILLTESDSAILRPLTRFRSAFTLRDGIFSPADRLRNPAYLKRLFSGEGKTDHSEMVPVNDVQIFYSNSDPLKEKLFAEDCGWTPLRENSGNLGVSAGNSTSDHFNTQLSSESADPVSLLGKIGENIVRDTDLLDKITWKHPGSISSHSSEYPGVYFLGSSSDIWLHHEAEILPGSVFDSRNGPIIIDQKCRVSPFTYIEGPFYGGKGTMLDNVRITGGVIIGHFCRVGGEVENSIINDYSNKHHEGFLGHSFVGSWVNIGALATTSDLKNNYGKIRLIVEDKEIDTNTVKFGSIIADHVKIAIGTMINTGTIIDAGSNIFGGTPGKYIRPLSWGIGEDRYDRIRFRSDAEKIMLRRKQSPNESFSVLLEKL